MGKRKYFSQWIYIAFRHSIGIGDGVAFLIGLAIPIIRQLIPGWETVILELGWQIPLGVFSSVIVIRLLLAPYWMYKRLEKERDELLNVTRENGVIVIKHPPQLEIRICDTLFGVSGGNGFPPCDSSDQPARWLRLGLDIELNVPIETLGLVISRKLPPIPAYDWTPGRGAYYYYFKIPDWVKNGEQHVIQVQAFASGKTWGSSEMSMGFPG